MRIPRAPYTSIDLGIQLRIQDWLLAHQQFENSLTMEERPLYLIVVHVIFSNQTLCPNSECLQSRGLRGRVPFSCWLSRNCLSEKRSSAPKIINHALQSKSISIHSSKEASGLAVLPRHDEVSHTNQLLYYIVMPMA